MPLWGGGGGVIPPHGTGNVRCELAREHNQKLVAEPHRVLTWALIFSLLIVRIVVRTAATLHRPPTRLRACHFKPHFLKVPRLDTVAPRVLTRRSYQDLSCNFSSISVRYLRLGDNFVGHVVTTQQGVSADGHYLLARWGDLVALC